MNETKKRRVILALTAVAVAVVFFFAGFGTGYGIEKGADPAPDAAWQDGSLQFESSSSDGLRIRPVSAAVLTGAADLDDGFIDTVFNPLEEGLLANGAHTAWFTDESSGSYGDFPFESYTFLQVTSDQDLELMSINWNLEISENDLPKTVSGEYAPEQEDPRNSWSYRLYAQYGLDYKDAFLDLTCFQEDPSMARLGCKMPFWFGVTVHVEALVKGTSHRLTADCKVDYLRSSASKSAIEFTFSGLHDPIAVPKVGRSDFYSQRLYFPVRVPVYAYSVLKGESYLYQDGNQWSGGEYDVAGGLNQNLGIAGEEGALISAETDVLRHNSGLNYLASILSQGSITDLRDPAELNEYGFADFSVNVLGFDSPKQIADVVLWTVDDFSEAPAEIDPGFDFAAGFDSDSVRVTLGAAFKEIGGMFDDIDPYPDWQNYDLEFDGDNHVTFPNGVKGYLDAFAERESCSLLDFCYYPGVNQVSGNYSGERYYTAREKMQLFCQQYLTDPSSYEWKPAYYMEIYGYMFGIGLDFSGGPNGYRATNR